MVRVPRRIAISVDVGFLVDDHYNEPKLRIADKCQQRIVEFALNGWVEQNPEGPTLIDDIFPMQDDRFIGIMTEEAGLQCFQFGLELFLVDTQVEDATH